MRDPGVRILKDIGLFTGTSRRQLRSVVNLGTFVDVPAGTTICREGAAAREFVVVVGGQVALERARGTVAKLCSGDAWGEPRRPNESCSHAATATATTDSCLLVYNRQEYVALLARCPKVAERLSRTATLEVLRAHGSVAAFSRKEERWAVTA